MPQHFLDLLSPFSGSAGTNLRHVNRGETETASGVDALTFTYRHGFPSIVPQRSSTIIRSGRGPA